MAGRLEITSRFQLADLDSTGVAPTSPATAFCFPAERSEDVSTGLAVRLAEEMITFTLYDQNGGFLQTTTLPFEGARFFHEIFGGVPADFVGSVVAESTVPLYLTVLRQEVTFRQPLRFQLTSVPATPVPGVHSYLLEVRNSQTEKPLTGNRYSRPAGKGVQQEAGPQLG